jgi:uncharacterized protein
MAERTSHPAGTPSWVDLGAPDVDRAAAFYSELLGWQVAEAGPAEETGGYRMAFLDGKAVAGLGPAQDPGPPRWTTYVTVDDVAGSVARVEAAGGSVLMAPMAVMTAGHMAVVADPEGAVLSLWQPGEHIGAQLVNEPGTLCWNELNTRQPEAAARFYGEVFGWECEPSEGYVSIRLGGRSIGGMLPAGDHLPAEVPAHWLAYFAVAEHGAAVDAVRRLGGTVFVEAMEADGVGTFSVVTDDQGATFALIQLLAADD